MRKTLALSLSSLLLSSCVFPTFEPTSNSSSSSAEPIPASYNEFHAAAEEADSSASSVSINERKVQGQGTVVSELGTCTFTYTEYYRKQDGTLKLDSEASTYEYSDQGSFLLLQFSLAFKIEQKAVNIAEDENTVYTIQPLSMTLDSVVTTFDQYGNVISIKDSFASSDSTVRRNYTITITYTYSA